MVDQLVEYLGYPFVRHALVVGTLISVAAALLGVSLVLRRLSNMGDGLSHVAFAAMAIGGVMCLTDNFLPGLVATSACSVVLLSARSHSKTKGDAALAMLSVGMLALGYLAVNLFPTSSNVSGDVCTTLFGSTSILTLSDRDVWVSGALSVAVAGFCVWTHHRSLEFAFDEDFARVEGGRVRAFNTISALVVAVVVVVSIRLVGALLVSALLVFPAASALRIFKSYRAVCAFAALFAAVSALTGVLTSVLAGTPVGATIIAVDMFVFAVCWIIGKRG